MHSVQKGTHVRVINTISNYVHVSVADVALYSTTAVAG